MKYSTVDDRMELLHAMEPKLNLISLEIHKFFIEIS